MPSTGQPVPPAQLLPVAAPAQQQLPPLWLGTWSLAGVGFGRVDQRQSARLIDEALAHGWTHLDTAALYARGDAERLVGRCIRGGRQGVFISSKGGLRWQGNEVRHAAGGAALREDLEGSLRRLGTDYLDLYQLHWPDPQTPIEQSLDALRRFQDEGLIRGWGVCNFDAQQVRQHLPPQARVVHQVHISAVHRCADVLRAGYEEGRAFHCATSPLEQGLLGDGQGRAALRDLGNKDVRRRNRLFHDAGAVAWAAQFHRLCAAARLSPVAVALAWVCSEAHIDAVIIGPKTPQQLQTLLAILQHFAGDAAGWLADAADETLTHWLQQGAVS